MKPLAEAGKHAVLDGLIEVVPDNQRTILLNWLENIRDWCISRQLWWGHRIPIWHCAACKEMVPALDSRVEIVDGHARAASVPTKCPKCGGSQLTQDTDVLDTWFSSGLWPFSTLGWPDDTADLRTFYPTSLLISGYDILFFWDARMIMMGLHLTSGRPIPAQRIPFRRLYLHSLVRTAEGAKMSKTKGTGVDPLELTQKFGTDALRYMLASMAAPGTDIILSEDRILGARAFANKIWNAARFLFVNLEKAEAQGITHRRTRRAGYSRRRALCGSRRRRSRASLDFLAALGRLRAGQRRAREFPLPRSRAVDLPLLLGRFLRLVYRVGQAAAHRRPRRRRAGLAKYLCRARSRPAPAASGDAFPHRRALASPAATRRRAIDRARILSRAAARIGRMKKPSAKCRICKAESSLRAISAPN